MSRALRVGVVLGLAVALTVSTVLALGTVAAGADELARHEAEDHDDGGLTEWADSQFSGGMSVYAETTPPAEGWTITVPDMAVTTGDRICVRVGNALGDFVWLDTYRAADAYASVVTGTTYSSGDTVCSPLLEGDTYRAKVYVYGSGVWVDYLTVEGEPAPVSSDAAALVALRTDLQLLGGLGLFVVTAYFVINAGRRDA